MIAGYPLFPDSPIKYNVSLSIPMSGNSEISKSIGLTSSSPLLVPNVEYIKKFSEGDMGISDSIQRESLYLQLNSTQSSKDSKIFKKYGDKAGLDTNVEKYKTFDGKYKAKKSDINPPTNDGSGLKSFEKVVTKSIFETQKPYMEIIKLVVGNLSKIEDIIARIMPLVNSSMGPLVPLVTKSLKPNINDGVSGITGRPKAMGFQSGSELKEALSKLQSLTNSGKKVNIDKNGNVTRTQSPVTSSTNSNKWKIISTIYSTGYFDPNVTYNYNYINLPADSYIEEKYNPNIGDDDLFSNYKPDNIILGVFDKNGNLLDPHTYKNADWVLRSPKWKFPSKTFIWPVFTQPTYNKVLTVSEYKLFYTDIAKSKMNQSEGLTQDEKDQYSNEIINKIDIQSQVENTFSYGQLKSSVYKTTIPESLKTSFKPFQIYSASASVDPILSKYAKSQGKDPGYIWIDPESDYEMKVIRVDVNSVVDSKNLNKNLTTDKLFSTGKYGVGTSDDPQDIGIIQRYKISQSDIEYYYIIEGVSTDKNTQTTNSNSPESLDSKYYRLPHAIGAIKVFISMLVDVFSKLIPSINKLLKLLKNPSEFIIDILTDLLSDGFSLFSKKSTDSFNSANKNITTKPSIKNKEMKTIIKDGDLSNYVYVDKKNIPKCVLDGSTKIDMNIVGTFSIGMELNYSDIPKPPIKKTAKNSEHEQPLFKMLLGIVTFPIKIVAKIIQWIMDFFKSLTNPLTLPSKIIEFLTFGWIMDFFTPKFILGLLGITFEPSQVPKWIFGTTIPDFSLFLGAPFMCKLPTYTNKQVKNHIERPFKFLFPIFGFLEKLINVIIDLLWAIIGIEALIPSPHITLSSSSSNPGQMDADNIKSKLNKDISQLDVVKIGHKDITGVQGFLYDVTLENGTIIKSLNYDELQKYIKDNENLNYDFKF